MRKIIFFVLENPDGSFVFIQLPSILSNMLAKNDADVEPKREIKTEECEETEKVTKIFQI